MADRANGEFDALVEAVRVGTILAHDQKQANRWHRRSRSVSGVGRRTGGGLTGQALERAVAGLARMHPEYVVMGG